MFSRSKDKYRIKQKELSKVCHVVDIKASSETQVHTPGDILVPNHFCTPMMMPGQDDNNSYDQQLTSEAEETEEDYL